MRARSLLGVLLLSAVLAGCLVSDEDAGEDPDAWRNGDPLSVTYNDDHNHSVAAHHDIISPTMRLVGHTDLEPELLGGNTYGELDIQGDYAYVGTLDPGGFVVVDISDPARPVEVGRYVAGPQSYGADVKVTPDGAYAFLAVSNYQITPSTNPNTIQGNLNRLPSLLQQLQSNPEGQLSFGVQIIDLSDKASPELVSFYPTSPRGVHMLFHHEMDGREIVATATVGFTPVATEVGGEPVRQDLFYQVDFLEFDRSGPVPTLVKVSEYRLQSLDRSSGGVEALGPWNVHDVSLFDDPLGTGRVYALASYWDWGAHILDITDLPEVSLVGVWDDFDPRSNGNIHTLMMDKVGDRRIITATEELFELTIDEVQFAYTYVIDATDIENPVTAGRFSLPGENHVEGIRFSTHNHQFVDGKVFVAWYHAGVWVLDVSSPERQAEPEILGFAHPNVEPARDSWRDWFESFGEGGGDVPDTWDVVIKDGRVYALDRMTGIYVYELDGLETDSGIDSLG